MKNNASLSDFEIIGILGKGSFSSVFLARRKKDHHEYALKSVQLEKLSKKEQENSINEARILASIDHPNIIGYKDCFMDENKKVLYIVMEYANGGDLSQKIKEMKLKKKQFEENQIWLYAIQMIEGLKVLHLKKIMHRDIKSANIYLIKGKNICKIGDLNVSVFLRDKNYTTQTGTPYYASPEVWKNQPYNYKSDLWSVGCIIFELCTLHPPFRGKNLEELCQNICNGKIEKISKKYSDNLWNIILLLLEIDVKKRVDCDQFLSNEIIKNKNKEIKLDNSFLEDNLNMSDKNQKDISDLNIINIKDIIEIQRKLPHFQKYTNESLDDDITIKNDDSLNTSCFNSSKKIQIIVEKNKNSNLRKNISKSQKFLKHKQLNLDNFVKKYRKIKSDLYSKTKEKYNLLIIEKKTKIIKTEQSIEIDFKINNNNPKKKYNRIVTHKLRNTIINLNKNFKTKTINSNLNRIATTTSQNIKSGRRGLSIVLPKVIKFDKVKSIKITDNKFSLNKNINFTKSSSNNNLLNSLKIKKKVSSNNNSIQNWKKNDENKKFIKINIYKNSLNPNDKKSYRTESKIHQLNKQYKNRILPKVNKIDRSLNSRTKTSNNEEKKKLNICYNEKVI